MRKLIWSLGIIGICLISGCLKSRVNQSSATCDYPESQAIAPGSEVDSVKKYLTLRSLTATQHPSGLFYTVTGQGTGAIIANLCTVTTVRYTARLANGTVFDSTGAGVISFQLGQTIAGWQKGLPQVSEGGKITLYIPPTLGYGSVDQKDNTGKVIIPANSILIFDIELLDVN